jgi:hypothetical protein
MKIEGTYGGVGIGTFQVNTIENKVNGNYGVYGLPAKNGEWEAEIIDAENGDIGVLRANLKGNSFKKCNDFLSGRIAVDSGQAGIFDSEFYPKGETGEYDDEDSFYHKVCHCYPNDDGGTVEGGAVSTNSIGDGCYEAYVCKDENGLAIAVEVHYMENQDDEDDWDEDDDEEEEY